MKIWLERTMSAECSGDRPCELCEAEFEPRPVLVLIEPDGFEICDGCTEALLRHRDRNGVQADWPTWEKYQQALRDYPEPMMGGEEARRAQELGIYDDFFALAEID